MRKRILSEPAKPAAPIEEIAAATECKRLGLIESMIEDLAKQSGDRYRKATIGNWVADSEHKVKVKQAMIDYCANIESMVKNGHGVVLYGPAGAGKDHLAVAVARAACKEGISVRWVKGQDWFGSLRDSIDSAKNEAELFRSLRCDMLAISDPVPPMGPLTAYQASMLYRLIEDRYSSGGVVVTTVNVATDEEADARMGAQTWDRLCDGALKCHCNWPSYRKPWLKV